MKIQINQIFEKIFSNHNKLLIYLKFSSKIKEVRRNTYR